MNNNRSREVWLLLLIGIVLMSTTTDASQDSETGHMGEDVHADEDHMEDDHNN